MIFLWNGVFLSASASRSVLFFFFSVVHACAAGPNLPGRRKSDTARCHWQREVNVIRRPLPRQRAVLRNACTRVPDQNVCVTSRSMWELFISVSIKVVIISASATESTWFAVVCQVTHLRSRRKSSQKLAKRRAFVWEGGGLDRFRKASFKKKKN